MRASVVLLAVLPACIATWFPAPTPMHHAEWKKPGAKAKCLVVFLPGFGDDAEDFEEQGFVGEVRKRDLSVDMVAAQATLGYYARGTFAERTQKDVVDPARARGYEQVWVVGMSMGGMGTFLYSRTHTAQVTGMFALAPYLGDKSIAREIHAQGGLLKWHAPPKPQTIDEDNYQREIWRWLQALALGTETGPSVYLAYGKDDKLREEDNELFAVIPEERRFQIEGAHDWETWKVLFGFFLDRSELGRTCR